jgi:flagellar motility protein MotE (MotC chaperone)
MSLLKRLLSVMVVVLALNFVVTLGAGTVFVYQAGLDREKMEQVRELLFPPPVEEVEPLEADDLEPAQLDAAAQISALLAEESGASPAERISSQEAAIDHRAADLARIRRELADRARQLEQATARLADERDAFARVRDAWQAEVDAAMARSNDAGFNQAVELYSAMPARQVKDLLLGLEDDTLLAILRAMEVNVSAKILREFKTDPEKERARRVLEMMRENRQDAADLVAGAAGTAT